MESIQKKNAQRATTRIGFALPSLLLVFALFLRGSLGDENKTSKVVEAPPGVIDEHSEELEIDRRLKIAFESAGKTFSSYNEGRDSLIRMSNKILEDHGKGDGIADKLESIEKAKVDMNKKIDSVDQRIREINMLQVLDLKEKVQLLHQRELKRRAMLEEKEEFLIRRQEKLKEKKKKRKLKKKLKGKMNRQGIPDDAIKKDEWTDLVDVKGLLDEGDKRLEDFFLEIVEGEVENLQGELEDAVIKATQSLNELDKQEGEKGMAASSGDCSGATLTDAVQLVQDSLNKFSRDKVGMVDHLSRAYVVHHLTSENFVPPSVAYQALDEQWWFKYVPEDWEKAFDAILPEKWRKWNVAIPDYVYHSFGLHTRATTAPPKVILHSSLSPGSCWPMAGQSGQVTLRLPYPVKVKAITVDHAPSLLFEDQAQRQSAPRLVRVFGFPPCWKKKAADEKASDYLDDYLDNEDDENAEYYRGVCEDGLDFDLSKPIVLHDIEYDLEGPSIQTFHIPLPEEESDDEEAGGEGSCSEDTGTCGGGLDGGANDYMYSDPERSETINEGVSAVRFEVTGNHGNKDYTCIYRFRIHGDAVDPVE